MRAVGFGGYKWYQSQTPNTKRCASEEAEPQRGWTWGSVLTRTLGFEEGRLGGPTSIREGKSVREDAGTRRGWIVRSHIGWEGRGWIVRSHIGWGWERNILSKGVETSS